MPVSSGKRAANRVRMERDIRAAGREQLAAVGPAQLSLREVARALDVAPSAVYRYVQDRDALLNVLLQEVYNELANAVLGELTQDDAHDISPRQVEAFQRDQARQRGGSGDDDRAPASSQEFETLITRFALAMRSWALAHPNEWALLYGTPVHGFAADPKLTTAPGTRLMRWLAAAVVELANAHGEPTPLAGECPTAEGPVSLFAQSAAHELDLPLTPESLTRALHIWSLVVGAISSEVFGQWGPTPPGLGEELLRRMMAQAAIQR